MLNSRTLRFKINIAIFVTFVAISVIFSALLTVFEMQRRSNAIKQDVVVLNELVQHNKDQLGNEIFAGHDRAVKLTLGELVERDNILAASAFDDLGAFFSTTEEGELPDLAESELLQLQSAPLRQETTWNGLSVLVYTAAVQVYGEIVGYVRLEYSLASLNSETWHIVAIFSGLLLTFLFLMAGLLNIMMTRMVLNPVYSLKNAMLQVIRAGNPREETPETQAEGAGEDSKSADIREMVVAFDHIYSKFHVNYESADEIGALALSFRHMVGALRNSYLELKQAEEKYHSIFENALEGLFQLDQQGRILSANKAMAQLWGYASEQEMVAAVPHFGRSCFARPEDLDHVLDAVRRQGRVSGVELEFTIKEGVHFWGSMALHFVTGSSGDLLYYEGSVVDITERLEKERAQSEREIAEAAARARREIMDNSGQGFLSFGLNLLVEEEYSLECETIFQTKEIAGNSIDSLLFASPCSEQKDFANNLMRILSETKAKRRRLFLSLMPREFLLDDRHIKVSYRLLSSQRMMLILTDVTKQRALEHAVELERSRLAFIVSSIKNRVLIFESVKEFQELLQDISGASDTPPEQLEEVLREIYRKIHTAKGNFALLDFVYLPRELHTAEFHLAHWLEDGDLDQDPLASMPDVRALQQAVDADCAMIREALGDEYFDGKGNLTIPVEKIQGLMQLGEMILSRYGEAIDGRTAELVRELHRIRYVELSSLLEVYPRLVQQLAVRLDKEVSLFQIEGPSIRVDPERFGPFARALVHVFRNAIDHGIESPDKRLEAGKEVAGKIRCWLDLQGQNIKMVISDDGQGIDLEVLRKNAEERGLKSAVDDPTELIFMDGISSKQEASDLSGRGVGLAAVKASVEALGGHIRVESESGKGTSIHISLPVE